MRSLFLLRGFVFVIFLLEITNVQASEIKPQRMALFPTPEAISVEKAKQIYDSLRAAQKEVDFYIPNSHHHWLVYHLKPITKQQTLVIEIPDYQINEVDIFLYTPLDASFKKVLRHGDELQVSEWTHPNRAAHALLHLAPHQEYYFYVYYSRPGNRPQFTMQLHEPAQYFLKWSRIERSFGFLYGLIFVYLVFIIILSLYSRNKSFFYLSVWVLVYLGYFFISSGHFKYLFNIYIPNLYSTIRVSIIFFGLYAMHAYSLIHYNKVRELWFVTLFWDLFLLLLLLLNSYNFITGDNIFNGHEIEFIWLVRALVVVLLITQIYLPYNHFKHHKKITFLTYLLAFSGLNFIVYIVQTTVFENIDFNEYIFTTIWFLIIEIVIIALGFSIFSLKERKRKSEIDLTFSKLQREARVLQFEVQEKERKRIATELHDDIMNRLSVSLLLFRDRYSTHEQFVETLKEISSDIKQYSLGIYPIWVEQRDMVELIREYINPIAQAKSIIFEFDVSRWQKDELHINTKLHVFRLVQEFVKNAVTHGHPKTIAVKLFNKDAHLNLELIDDGVGYNLETAPKGLGSESVKNRIQVLGGHLHIYTEPGKGVRWYLSIPKD
jgi:signal transduction histidine kinase